MTSQRTFEHARRAIAELDLSSENEQIARLEAEIRRFQAAISTADERRTKIQGILQARRDDRREGDANAVAEALLAGDTAVQAAHESPPDETLKTELLSLRDAMSDLTGRVENVRQQIETIRGEAAHRAAECMTPVVEEITAELRECAQRLLTGFAELSAINRTTRGHTLARFAVEKALPGLYSADGLAPYQRRVDVPREIVDTLGQFEGKGAALPLQVPETVALP